MLICALGLAGWLSGAGAARGENYFKIHAQDEAQFQVEQTLTDIAEMAFYAANKKLPGVGGVTVDAREKTNSTWATPQYAVEIKLDKKTVRLDLTVDQAIWSPEVYEKATKAVMDALDVKAKEPGSPQDHGLLTALLDGDAETIEARDRGVSEGLTGNMPDPTLHEKAAVVLGTFALRDSAGEFEDERLAMCRMAAHLAFAQGLAGTAERGVNGRLAHAMLLTLMNNQHDALAEVDKLKEPELAGWARILRARNTHDYRELAKTAPSVLEKIELFRARATAVSTDAAWRGFTNDPTKELPDYCRMLCKFGYSVETGHVINSLAMALEVRELGTMYRAYEGKTLGSNNLTEALSGEPRRCVTLSSNGETKVQVIGWGQWSFFSERHIEQAMTQDYYFLRNLLGVPEEAAAVSKETARLFSKIPLYPFLDLQLCTNDEGYHRAMDGMAALTQKSPQLISVQEWTYLYQPPPFVRRIYFGATNYHTSDWFLHSPLPGTAHEGGYRLRLPEAKIGTPRKEMADSLVAMAPHDMNIVTLSMEKFVNRNGRTPTIKAGTKYEDIEPYYRSELDYNVHYMGAASVTLEERPVEYEKMMLKVAALTPNSYFALGYYFIRRGEEDKGMGYLEKGMALADDDVLKSYDAADLIKYYVKKGRKAEAYKLADFVADEVYSYVGLQAKAELLESDGKYAEAADYYKKIEERYDQKGLVLGFYERIKNQPGAPNVDELARQQLKLLFPAGIEHVKLGDFSAAPKDGVLIGGQNGALNSVGLGFGMVIVALDGTRVHNYGQYSYVRETLKGPEMNFIVWNGNGYKEVKASPPNHRFGVDFPDYVPR